MPLSCSCDIDSWDYNYGDWMYWFSDNTEEFEEPPIKIADHYHCEKCAEIWLNLTIIGYECLSPSENMKKYLKEYQEMTGFKKQADD